MLKRLTQDLHPLYSALLLHMAKKSGLSVDKLLNTSQLERVKLRQSARWFVALLLKIQHASRHPAVTTGFEYGQQLDLASAGVIGQAVMTSPTLGKALNLMCRYYILTGPKLCFEPTQTDKEVALAIDLAYPSVPEPVRAFVFEALISSWRRCTGVMVGRPLIPSELCFDYSAPQHAQRYRDYFQCKVSFDCPKMTIKADKKWLTLPTLTANPVVHERSVAHCEAALQKLGIVHRFNDKVRRYLKMLPDLANVSIDSTALSMNLSSRTLSRRLQSEGYSFNQLLNEQRCEVACRLLCSGDWKLENIAEHVGYSDASNFRRAFRRWTGQTPSNYRSQHQH